MTEKKKLLVSFSAGRTSAYMVKWCKEHLSDEYEIIVVMANVGKEREESLFFAHQCDQQLGFNTIWIEPVTTHEPGIGMSAKVVSFEKAARKGEPFEEMIKKYGLPNHSFRHCSRQLKRETIRAYARDIKRWKGYYTAIGIRADEMDRINFEAAKKERIIYPLATMHLCRKEDINAFWAKMPFDLQLKSYEGNCDLCWKKSLRKLMTIVKDKPELADWWIEMEEKYGHYIPETRPQRAQLPIRMYYQGRSMREIVEASKGNFPPAIDESKILPLPTLFDIHELDRTGGCEESCEAF